MKVILLSGKIGSGKDTVAGVLTRLLKERNYNVELFAFADPLKHSVAYLRDESRNLFYSRQGKDGSGHEDQDIRRQLLVAIGEAACEIDPFIFCRKTKAIMENQQVRGSKQIFIITDLRKETELNFAIDNFPEVRLSVPIDSRIEDIICDDNATMEKLNNIIVKNRA